MNNKHLFLLTAFLLLNPVLASCNQSTSEKGPEDNITTPDGGETTPDDKPTTPDEGETTPDDKPTTPDEGETTPDENEDKPVVIKKSLKEVNDLCTKVGKSYKEKFDLDNTYKIKGTVIVDYAISGNSHFMVFTDGVTILPILIPANKTMINKFIVGNTYEVFGHPGSYRNTNCLKVMDAPIRCDKEEINLEPITTKSSISDVYDKAYNIYAEENHACLDCNLYSFKATYVEKINENLFMVFDGSKHIIIHGDNHVTNGLSLNTVYEFTVMPSVHQGKKGCEFVSRKATSEKDEDVFTKIKNVAIEGDVTKLSQTDRYNDDKHLYPFIFKTNCYISGMEKNGKIYFCLVDDPLTDVYYQKSVNERPATIFIKNHVVDEYTAKFSDLTPYYNDDIKGEFYFYVTNYQSEYHAFQAQVINQLINII